ncbi:hypothetical protein [Vibrio nomapromontoriensis]
MKTNQVKKTWLDVLSCYVGGLLTSLVVSGSFLTNRLLSYLRFSWTVK